MDETDYFSILKSAVNIKGKVVLEIGGVMPPTLVMDGNIKQWISIDISPKRLDTNHSSGIVNSDKYSALLMDASQMTFPDEEFDIVFSSNCFEHISDLPNALKHIHRVLKPGGILFTIFAPIWSGPHGHHTWVWDQDKPLTFSDNVFPDWHHLLMDETELGEYLNRKYRSELCESILRYVYRSNDINRRVDSDYELEIGKYGFKRIIDYRIQTHTKLQKEILNQLRIKYPKVWDFRTQGYFWLFSKGSISFWFRLRAYFGTGLQIVYRKLYYDKFRKILTKFGKILQK